MKDQNSEDLTKAENKVIYLRSLSFYLLITDAVTFTIFQILTIIACSYESLVILYSLLQVFIILLRSLFSP